MPIHLTPNERDVEQVVRATLHDSVASIRRFPTGLAHYVYDVVTASGAPFVVRLAANADSQAFAGALYWSERLRPRGVPLPRIVAADVAATTARFPFLLMERLQGTDLGHVYQQLSSKDKAAIVAEVVRAQRLAGSLPPGHGYGYAFNYDDPFPHQRWIDVLLASLARSRSRIGQIGLFDLAMIDSIKAQLPRFDAYLSRVQPTPFLDDTTTKNVLVHNGRLSGIVDVDVLCFGDPLWTVALTNMALRSSHFATDYMDMWCDLIAITDEQRHILSLYTAIFCIDFMSELGQAFNQDEAEPIDPHYVQHLNTIFADLMRSIS